MLPPTVVARASGGSGYHHNQPALKRTRSGSKLVPAGDGAGPSGALGIVSVDNLGEPPAGSAPLTLSEVHGALLELAVQSGDGSSTRKAQMLSEMMARATPLEAKFIVRSIRGKTRTGLGDRSLRAALAQAG